MIRYQGLNKSIDHRLYTGVEPKELP